jgi:hypothetical protein
MIAGLILGISILTLLQFFVSYCHFVIAKSWRYKLSECAREISGITTNSACGDHYRRLLQLLAMCPDPGGDSREMRLISTYFDLLTVTRKVLSRAAPSAAKWIESERGGCAYVAAVALDRRIACNRMLLAQQAGQ